MSGPVNAQVRRQTQYNGDRPLKLTTYRDSEIDEKTIQLLKVRKLSENYCQLGYINMFSVFDGTLLQFRSLLVVKAPSSSYKRLKNVGLIKTFKTKYLGVPRNVNLVRTFNCPSNLLN